MRRHLLRAERLLGARDVAGLDPVRRRNRRLLLAELARYRRAGRFPRNREFAGKAVPVFKDSAGTHCAVGHLLAVTGHGELVERVASSRNFARVRELADSRELCAWLDAAGLSLEEASLIQPAYCFITLADYCFCGSSGWPVVAQGTVVSVGAGTDATVVVERVTDNDLGLAPGAEVFVPQSRAMVGERILVATHALPTKPDPEYSRVGARLEIGESDVTCRYDEFSSSHPIPIEAAMAAIESDSVTCNAMMEERDATWGASPDCHEGGCGCRFADLGGNPAASLTAAGILCALVLRRRQRVRVQ